MSDNGQSNRGDAQHGESAAPTDPIVAAIEKLLLQAPDTWHQYRPDDLTETQSQALFLLTATGLVERRERLCVRMLNHPLGRGGNLHGNGRARSGRGAGADCSGTMGGMAAAVGEVA